MSGVQNHPLKQQRPNVYFQTLIDHFFGVVFAK